MYITGKGRETLKEKETEFLPKLENILGANRILVEFQAGLSPAEKPSQSGGEKDVKE